MRRLLACTLCACVLGCQAVSGLNDLRFVSVNDAGSCSGDRCNAVEGGCHEDADCGGGRCYASGSEKRCVRGCDFASGKPCSAPEVCAHLAELEGNYCVTPTASCETDGRCDEPAWGTRRCAAGSDAKDCTCQPQVAGASCNLVTQCGCSPGAHCALLGVQGTMASVGCAADLEPTREPAAACAAESECPAGYSCWRGLCEKYCAQDADCSSGQCVALRNPAEVSGLRVCSVACEFGPDLGCSPGTQCARAPDGIYCLVPRAPCPFENDGECDDPSGSRICKAGSDAVDCS